MIERKYSTPQLLVLYDVHFWQNYVPEPEGGNGGQGPSALEDAPAIDLTGVSSDSIDVEGLFGAV